MKAILSFFLFLMFNDISAQVDEKNIIRKGDFPEGIYLTLEDVLSRTPSSTDSIYFKRATANDSINLPEKAFFYYKNTNKKIKFPLAISHQGELYFQTYKKYTNKKDKGYDPDAYSRFCKVISYGRFIYYEENMRGRWSKALLGNISPVTYLINGKIKGIVLDLENKELNILRDCEDLNSFLTQHEIPKIECDTNKFTIGELRATIDEINKPYR